MVNGSDIRGELLCPVCYVEYDLAEFVHLPDCGHGLCKNCYTCYLTSKVTDAGVDSVMTTCPSGEGCGMIVPQRLFKQLLSVKLYERYRSFLTRSFVDLSKWFKWCPGRDCSRAVQSFNMLKRVDVQCDSCQTAFCNSCLREAHMPIDCESLTQWIDKIVSGVAETNKHMKQVKGEFEAA